METVKAFGSGDVVSLDIGDNLREDTAHVLADDEVTRQLDNLNS